MSHPIVTDYNLEALKTAAGWPGADRATLITLATVLAATGADREGASYFEALAADQPGQVLPLALAGFFQVRAGTSPDKTPASMFPQADACTATLSQAVERRFESCRAHWSEAQTRTLG